jgi:hypothetical protein
MVYPRSIGEVLRFLFPNELYGLVEAGQEIFEVFLENDNRMPLKFAFLVFLALHQIQEYIPIPIFLHIEEVRPFARRNACRKNLSP